MNDLEQTQTGRARRWPRLSLGLGLTLGLAVLALRAQPAAGLSDAADEAPTGMVAFFDRTDGLCPEGWRVATEAAGRIPVGVNAGDFVGKLVGTALTNQEDRTHFHAYTASVELPYKSITAANGGNGQGAASQEYKVNGNSQAVTSGLPFVQLTTCVKL